MTQKPLALPIIAENDYEDFRKIIPELPVTYAGWQEKHKRAKREHGESNTILEVPVSPDEFVAYCRDHDRPHREETLWKFARDNAPRDEADHKYDPMAAG